MTESASRHTLVSCTVPPSRCSLPCPSSWPLPAWRTPAVWRTTTASPRQRSAATRRPTGCAARCRSTARTAPAGRATASSRARDFSTNFVFVPAYRDGGAPYGKFAAPPDLLTVPRWMDRGDYGVDVGAAIPSGNAAGQTLSSAVEERSIVFDAPRQQGYSVCGHPPRSASAASACASATPPGRATTRARRRRRWASRAT